MIDTKSKYPFWITSIEDTEKILDSVKKGEVHTLCKSAGGRTIRYVTYGEKENYCRSANFSSACGAKDPGFYAKRKDKRPTIMLIGATHGQETEGVAAINNLITLIETGLDLSGKPNQELMDAYIASNCRLIIVPIYNIDGRARCIPDSMIDETNEGLRHHGQGRWKNGELCGWPECKQIHPIKDSCSHLGAYFNDDGINLMHDNFFAPMAEETAAMLKLMDDEAPACVIGLHGGSNTTNELLQPDYVPDYINQEVQLLATEYADLSEAHGLKRNVRPLPKAPSYPAPSFNLTSAAFHVCGAVTSTYESNEGLAEKNSFSAGDIILHHMCLFTSLFRHTWKY